MIIYTAAGHVSDAEGMAMLTGAFVFLIIMFLLLALVTWAVVRHNRQQARHNRAVYRFYSRQFTDFGDDVKRWWDR